VEDVEGCGRLSVLDGLLDVAWFFCVQVGWFVGGGNECKFYGGSGCWWKCECIGRQKGLCGSDVIRVTGTHDIKSVGMFEDDVT
jgi:hypothetical protein